MSHRPSAFSVIFFSAALLTLALAPGTAHAQRLHRGPTAGNRTKPSVPLAQQITTILSTPAARQAFWGISVTALDGSPVFSLNEDKHFAPASNAKLITTAAAFALYPVNHKFLTTVVAPARPDVNGIIAGDLTLHGTGDPFISARVLPYSVHTDRQGDPLAALDTLAVETAQAGVREIHGNIIGDDTWFPYEPYPPGWMWSDLQWEYGAPISALTINDNVVYLTIAPGAIGEPPLVSWNPPLPWYSVDNTARTVAAIAAPAKSDGATDHAPGTHASTTLLSPGKTDVGVERLPGSRTVRIWGEIASHAPETHLALAIDDPAAYAAAAFRDRLIAHGVRVDGFALAHHRPLTTTPQDLLGPAITATRAPDVPGVILAARTSPPLSEDLTIINKVSQNLHASLLVEDLGESAGRAAGLEVLHRMLTGAGVASSDVYLADGSGLSTLNYLTPRSLTQLLRFAATQPWAAAFRATLPQAGTDGTLSTRLADLTGRLQAKTGTLTEDNSLSGYVTDSTGRTLFFSILVNRHASTADTRSTVDQIITAIANAE
jgi:serine-type D-Ala-D-Ala carboxypeptidase/endopeptidase (penicillin-binding protein 4)